jgi:hypothetical protein
MSVSPPPWLQITIGIFGERLNVFVAVRPAAATTLTCCLQMTLPSYAMLNTRICIPACHIADDMDSIRRSINCDLFSSGYCIVSPEEVRLAVHKLEPNKNEGCITVFWLLHSRMYWIVRSYRYVAFPTTCLWYCTLWFIVEYTYTYTQK